MTEQPAGNPNPNRLNIYTCEECGEHFVTRDIHTGTTPFITSCQCTPGCKGRAYSSFYRVWDPDGRMKWTHEWYKPPLILANMSPAVIDHVRNGGLLLRRRADLPAVTVFTHRHKVRGSRYRIIGDVRIQISKSPIMKPLPNGEDEPVETIRELDGLKFTLYQGEDGEYSARWPAEFNDGRFEEIEGAQ